MISDINLLELLGNFILNLFKNSNGRLQIKQLVFSIGCVLIAVYFCATYVLFPAPGFLDLHKDGKSLKVQVLSYAALTCFPEQLISVPVEVINTSGKKIYSHLETSPHIPTINLGYFLIATKDGRETEGFHQSFEKELSAKDENAHRFQVFVRCPVNFGSYKVRIELVQEGRLWQHNDQRFADNYISLPLQVVDAKPEWQDALKYSTNRKKITTAVEKDSNLRPADRRAILSALDHAIRTLTKSIFKYQLNGKEYLLANAGGTYPEIWVRDLHTIDKVLSFLAPKYKDDTRWMNIFIDFQMPDSEQGIADNLRLGPASRPIPDKNDVQSDQELYLILSLLRSDPQVREKSHMIKDMLSKLFKEKWNSEAGCLTSAHVIDWGDVGLLGTGAPSTKLRNQKPMVCGIFQQALLIKTIAKLREQFGEHHPTLFDRAFFGGLDEIEQRARQFAREKLWQPDRGFFRIHFHLETLAHPFDEDDIFALYGNTLAIEAKMTSDADAQQILQKIFERQKKYEMATISAVVLPPYPAGTYENPILKDPFHYQNGGQWHWFGLQAIEILAKYDPNVARTKFLEIVAQVNKSGDFFEWYDQNSGGHGSPHFNAAAAQYITTLHYLFNLTGK